MEAARNIRRNLGINSLYLTHPVEIYRFRLSFRADDEFGLLLFLLITMGFFVPAVTGRSI